VNKHIKKAFSGAIAICMAVALAILSGCAGTTGTKQAALTPQVNPPAVKEAGVLRVGVDIAHAPFAGSSKGSIVGIDVDVAQAMAEQLGLKATIIDMAGQSPDDLLANGTVDVVMDVEQSGSQVNTGKLVGPYVFSGPALFTKTRSTEVPDIDIKTLAGSKIAAQKDSLSAWTVDELIGKGTSSAKDSLADALKAVNDGSSTYAAADAIVGSYLAVDYDNLSCVKILGTPIGVYCAVAASNNALAESLMNAMRTIRENGELSVIMSKWLGGVSSQAVINATQAITTRDATGTTTTAPAQGTAAGTDTPAEVDTGTDLPDPSLAG
jgi:polar amino acid transport system substrate-binding protein